MIGIGFLVRVIQFLFYFAVACALLYAAVLILNRGVQLIAGLLGVEVTDFFSWLRSRLPKRKKRNKRK